MIPFTLSLEYTLHSGWMAPFVEGLQAGKAVARACSECAHVSFPPLKTCACGSTRAAWQTLSGRADITARTTGADGDFALARFEGASGLATVRLADMPPDATRGTLTPATGALPQLILSPVRTT